MKIETRSTLTAFGIALCGCIVTAFTANPEAYKNPVVWIVILATAAGAGFKDNRSSYRIPEGASEDAEPASKKAGTLGMIGLISLIGLMGVSCASLRPGEDALVVRTEQSLKAADASFDLVLRVDHADRGFWKTNAPAFHGFCEWLRTPTSYGTNTLPRCNVMILNVNDLKRDYQRNKTAYSSNTLFLVLSTLENAAGQAGSWQTIVTAPTR